MIHKPNRKKKKVRKSQPEIKRNDPLFPYRIKKKKKKKPRQRDAT